MVPLSNPLKHLSERMATKVSSSTINYDILYIHYIYTVLYIYTVIYIIYIRYYIYTVHNSNTFEEELFDFAHI